MTGVTSCKQCGCSEIDNDPARGDSVCTNCGFVLEESIIVSEVAFEENGHGGSSAIGQFVSAESRGGGISSSANGFHSGISKESRELTLKSAKKKINEVAQQLRLNQHCVDVAFNFFKMALHKQLTKGRKNALTIAACVYMTCRIEGTPHLLIDFSDIAQIDVYALGRAYVQISRALFINIPAVDPCMYILRFAHKFNLADKTHDVAMTALRLVQRMKRDWIHLGRRPSGLCGAALLIAARLHSFSRSVQDIINVVKVHETTLRKRLIEFGETPSSSLTLDEFMSVDLEEEHDPPSFKAARMKDREMLQKLLDAEVNLEFKDIQRKIDEELEKRRKRTAKEKETPPPSPCIEVIQIEDQDASRFIMETTLNAINEFIADPVQVLEPDTQLINIEESPLSKDMDTLLMPPPTSFDLESSTPLVGGFEVLDSDPLKESNEDELSLDGIDDAELDAYIMNDREVARKTYLWEQLNSEYIIQQKLKLEQMEKDLREGKTEKKAKKKKPVKIKATFHAKSANEAIKIMLMERKISTKINYDVLKKLNAHGKVELEEEEAQLEPGTVIESGPIVRKRLFKLEESEEEPSPQPSAKRCKAKKPSKVKLPPLPLPNILNAEEETQEPAEELEIKLIELDAEEPETQEIRPQPRKEKITNVETIQPGQFDDDDDLYESGEEDENKILSARELLTKFRGEDETNFDDYY